MTAAFVTTTTSPISQSPYITVEEYRRAPTGVDAGALVPGDAAGSLAELANVVRRASSWADEICDQVLAATVDTEGQRLRVARDGVLKIHPRFTPLIAVTALSVGGDPMSLTPMSDLSGLWVEPAEFVVPVTGARTWQGPLSLGAGVGPGANAYAQYTYVSGFPNTTLAATVNAGATSITVADGTGLLPGQTRLTIYDDASTEVVTVAPSYVFGSTTVPLVAGLAFDHQKPGISVSALPAVVKQAVVLLTSALIKTRSASSITMAAVRDSPDRKTAKNVLSLDEAEDAKAMLNQYRRRR